MDRAIDFTLKDSEGNDFTLSSLRGSTVVLYFYPKDNTPGCTKEACSLASEFPFLKSIGATVVGVSPDSVKSHAGFKEKYSLPFTLLSDPRKEVMKKYGAYGEKLMYGKKTVGVIRSTFIIDSEGKIIKEYRKVNTSTHGYDVSEYLKSINRAFRENQFLNE